MLFRSPALTSSGPAAERGEGPLLRKVFCGFSPFPRPDAEYDDDAPAVLLHNGAVGSEHGKTEKVFGRYGAAEAKE